jgi:hypothetical protein
MYRIVEFKVLSYTSPPFLFVIPNLKRILNERKGTTNCSEKTEVFL